MNLICFQKTLGNYLDSLQPYFQIIRCFKDFDTEIMTVKYPDLNLDHDSAQSPQQYVIPQIWYIFLSFPSSLLLSISPFKFTCAFLSEQKGRIFLMFCMSTASCWEEHWSHSLMKSSQFLIIVSLLSFQKFFLFTNWILVVTKKYKWNSKK